FLQELKTSALIPSAPAHLQERLSRIPKPFVLLKQKEADVLKGPRPTPSTTLLAATMAMFIMVIAGLILYALPKQSQKGSQELAMTPVEIDRAAVEIHEGIIRGKDHFDIMSSDPAVIVGWVQQYLDFPLVLPQEEVASMHLVGGKVIPFQEKKAALLGYEYKDYRVTLLVTSPKPAQVFEGKETPLQNLFFDKRKEIQYKNISFNLAKYQGYYALTWTDAQYSYVLVSDRKARIAEACRICHGGNDYHKIDGFEDLL
ncbi:MAG: hypothetical protein ACREIQ_06730, partial [Nitrospiria bacterium]